MGSKITFSASAQIGFAGYGVQLDMDITAVDDIGSPALPFDQVVKDNAAAFSALIIKFIADHHPDLAPADLGTGTIYGQELATYFP
jgi:hypothetical protein